MGWFLAWLAVFLGALVQAITGFGLAIVCVPFLLLIDSSLAPIPVLMAAWVHSILMLQRYRHDIHAQQLVPAILGRVPGVLLAVTALLYFDSNLLNLIIGLMILLAVWMSARGWQMQQNHRNFFLISTVSGMMGTISGVGGPPMAMLVRQQKPDQIRGFLAGYFFIGTLISILSLALAGLITDDHLIAALAFSPAVLLGTFLGPILLKRYRLDNLEKPLLWLCAIGGVWVIVDNL